MLNGRFEVLRALPAVLQTVGIGGGPMPSFNVKTISGRLGGIIAPPTKHCAFAGLFSVGLRRRSNNADSLRASGSPHNIDNNSNKRYRNIDNNSNK
jgi:hypothetical protein